MIFDVLLQFLIELVRALLVDELSGRVRGRVRRAAVRHGSPNIRRAILGVHHQNRQRLLNRLITDLERDL
jgi:hypothetical protein